MHPDDMKVFLSIVQLLKDGKLNKSNKMCFITGILAGLNCEDPDIFDNIMDLPEVYEHQEKTEELDQLLQSVEEFND